MTQITTGALAKLLDTTPKTVADLAKREIITSAGKRGHWQLEPSITAYVRHLREAAAARGGEDAVAARARLGQAQASLAETKAGIMRGELVEADAVEAFWRTKLKAFRNRILAVPGRVRDLKPRQNVVLTQELRAALEELAAK
ncbi:MAG TPA: hypothetical protein VMW68_00785 [Methyloceanibacter sp.]|nr:hypothetical protein [Methyloceanibacter sp.]